MPFPSYLSSFSIPAHHNAYRRALADEKVDFSTNVSEDDIAKTAAELFLPHPDARPREESGALYWGAPVRLKFTGTAHDGSKFEQTLKAIARGGLKDDVQKGRAVILALADTIRPALKTGNIGCTSMARAAAIEIAVAIANPKNLMIGTRSVLAAVNGTDNPVGCNLAMPDNWGIQIHASENEIRLCESSQWDRYHFQPSACQSSKGKGKGVEPRSPDVAPARNVGTRDRNVLIADTCTTFKVKTSEWWLTRKLFPHRSQRATVAAKIELLHADSPDKTLHDALLYENGTKRHRASNWLAFLCRFMRGVCISRVGKKDMRRELNPMRAFRNGNALPNDNKANDVKYAMSQCAMFESKSPELIDDDARRVGRRSGAWSDKARYNGKVELRVDFEPVADSKDFQEGVTWAQDDTVRKPGYAAFPKDPSKSSSSSSSSRPPETSQPSEPPERRHTMVDPSDRDTNSKHPEAAEFVPKD